MTLPPMAKHAVLGHRLAHGDVRHPLVRRPGIGVPARPDNNAWRLRVSTYRPQLEQADAARLQPRWARRRGAGGRWRMAIPRVLPRSVGAARLIPQYTGGET